MLHIYLQKEKKKKHDATTLAQFDKKKNNLQETTCYPEVNKHSTKKTKQNKKTEKKNNHIFK